MNGTMRFTVEAGALVSKPFVNRILTEAWALDLDADVQTAGGWLSKTHRFTIKGPEPKLRVMIEFVHELEAALA